MGEQPGPQWRKSSHSFSNGNCLEAASWRTSTRSYANGACAEVAAWRKSTGSNSQGACVEAGNAPSVVGVRDSKDPTGPVLEFTPRQWDEFLSTAASYALELRKPPPAPNTLPLESVLSGRFM